MIVWTAERIRAVAPEFPLYFAVDDDALKRCLNHAGFEVVSTRTDHPSGTDRLAEANASIGATAVINVQGDEPLVPRQLIHQVAQGLENDPAAAIVTICKDLRNQRDYTDPSVVKVVMNRQGYAMYFSRAPLFMR